MTPPAIPPELDALEDQITEAMEPCIILSPAMDDEARRRTRLGGHPDLPLGHGWPMHGERPMSFVGQLDFAELGEAGGPALGLPESGLLSLFYDVDGHPDGSAAGHRDGWELVWWPLGDRVARTTPPEGALHAPSEPLTAHPAFSIPSSVDETLRQWSPDPRSEPWYADYRELSERFAISQFAVPPIGGMLQQVGGHADWTTRDGRVVAQLASRGEAAPAYAGHPTSRPAAEVAVQLRRWKLLWQLQLLLDPSTWIDRGTLYVLIEEDDLALQAFHRAWLVFLGSY